MKMKFIKKGALFIVTMALVISFVPSILVKADNIDMTNYAIERGDDSDILYKNNIDIDQEDLTKGHYIFRSCQTGAYFSTGSMDDYNFVADDQYHSGQFTLCGSQAEGFTFIRFGNPEDHQYYIKTNRNTYFKRTGSGGSKKLEETNDINNATVWEIYKKDSVVRIHATSQDAYLGIDINKFYLSVNACDFVFAKAITDKTKVDVVIRPPTERTCWHFTYEQFTDVNDPFPNYYRDTGLKLDPRSLSKYLTIKNFDNNFGVTTQVEQFSGSDELITYSFVAHNSLTDEDIPYSCKIVLKGYVINRSHPDEHVEPAKGVDGYNLWYATNYDKDAHKYNRTDYCTGIVKEVIPYQWDTSGIKYSWDYTGSACSAYCPSISEPGYSKTEYGSIAVLNQVNPTCTQSGTKQVQATFQSSLFTTQTNSIAIPPLGHDWGAPEYTWSDDNLSCTASRTCNRCQIKENEIATATLETRDPDYQNDGEKTYTASFRNQGFSQQVKKIPIPKLIDTTRPEASIQISANKWTTFWNQLTNGLLFNDTQTVRVSASDQETGIASTQYYLSDRELSPTEALNINNSEWINFTDTFNVDHYHNCVVYVKVADRAGNMIIINSDRVVVDCHAPTITGIEDEGKYYGDVDFGVTDDSLSSVEIDGNSATPVDGKYKIVADNKQHTIVATDRVGNQTSYTVTVDKIYDITFKTDSVTYAVKHAGYGTDLTDIPQIPHKTGSDAVAPYWDCKDFTNITSDRTVNAVYTLNTYDVDLPTGVGFTTGSADSTHVTYGSNFTFKVELNREFQKSDDFQVSVNGNAIQPVTENGQTLQYRFTVNEKPVIKVSGLEDVTPPEVVISLKDNLWDKFMNLVTFKHFYKGAQTADIVIKDASGVADASYIISDKPYHSIGEIPNSWSQLKKDKDSYKLPLVNNSKNYIYVKATDASGNTAVVNSDGIVLYSESKLNTEKCTAVKSGNQDVVISTNLNGNTIKEIRINGNPVDKKNYTVSPNGEVHLKASYVNSLANQDYQMEIILNPNDEDYAAGNDNDIPEKMTLTFSVVNPSKNEGKNNSPNTGLDTNAIMHAITLLIISAGAVIALRLYTKHKRRQAE